MTSVRSQASTNSCYICSLIPHAVGTDRLYLSQEVSPSKTKCLIHLYLCRIKAKLQPNTIVPQEVTVNLTKYDITPEVLYILTEQDEIQSELDKLKKKGQTRNWSTWPRNITQRGFLEFAKPPTQCNNMSVPMPTCGPRLALSVTGAVFVNNKWTPNVQFTCRAINLGNRNTDGSHGVG